MKTSIEKKKITVEKASKPKTTAKKREEIKLEPPVSHGVGRRKSSVARVWLRRGNGKMFINKKSYKEYFDTEISYLEATSPFRVCKEALHFDVYANVNGGGKKAQADAVKLGFARALLSKYEDLRPVLREYDLLTVDDRVKERKKYGQKGARRKFQFVKR